MPRKASSQWAFGELFADQELRQVHSVSELTANVRRLLEERIGTVWVRGEISNLRAQSSGHAYFTLKDPEAQLSCVLFRGAAVRERTLLDNGAQVFAHGEITVYEPRGQYQLVVRELEFQGAGALQLAFEKLKRQLEAQGYFSPERKRRLRRIPDRIGLVTSPAGAAIRDVLHVIQRRQPGLEIVLAPCRVQGDGSAQEIAGAIDELNRWSGRQPQGRGLDLILVTRGGGSLEDLWAFNELAVAEAIYRSALPVVSAIGHETDFTICDFVADLRAATPSAAAEILTEGAHASRMILHNARRKLSRAVALRINGALAGFESARGRLIRCRPTRLLQERMQYLDETRERIERATRNGFARGRLRFSQLNSRFARVQPLNAVRRARESLANAADILRRAAQSRLRELKAEHRSAADQLRLLSPEQTISRGYSITTDGAGRIIRTTKEVQIGASIQTRTSEGTLTSRVTGKADNKPLPD